MKMNSKKSMGHKLIECVHRMAASRLALELTDAKVVKCDLQDADLKLHLSNGRVVLISAVEHNITGKPTLEFEVSPLTSPEPVLQ